MKGSFYKVWDVLLPFILYYLVYNTVFILLAFVINVSMENLGGNFSAYLLENAGSVNAVAGAFSMLAGILPLRGMLKKELEAREKVKKTRRELCGQYSVSIVLAVLSSLGLNSLFLLTGLINISQPFQSVRENQFGAAFGIGLICYGVISPLAEEVVFRGIMYNRLRRYFPVFLSIPVSGLLFGCCHGNLVQGIYGTCMGILIAYLYERFGRFTVPFLFHAVANTAVYFAVREKRAHDAICRPAVCAFLLVAAAVCVIGTELIVRRRRER